MNYINLETQHLSPADFAEGKETRTMIFPRQVMILLQDGRKVIFPKGVHEVPSGLEPHIEQYLKDSGAAVYVPEVKESKLHKYPATEEDLKFAEANGQKFDSLEKLQDFIDAMPDSMLEDYKSGKEAWKNHLANLGTGNSDPVVDPTADHGAAEALKGGTDAAGEGKQ